MFGRPKTRAFTALALACLYFYVNLSIHQFHTCGTREEPVRCDCDASRHRDHPHRPRCSADSDRQVHLGRVECAACAYLKAARSTLPAATRVIECESPSRVFLKLESLLQVNCLVLAYSIRAPPSAS